MADYVGIASDGMPTLYVPKSIGIFHYESSGSGEPLFPVKKEEGAGLTRRGEEVQIFLGCSEKEGWLYRVVYIITSDSTPITRSHVFVTPIDNPSLLHLDFFVKGYQPPKNSCKIPPLMLKYFPELQKEVEQGLITVSE